MENQVQVQDAQGKQPSRFHHVIVNLECIYAEQLIPAYGRRLALEQSLCMKMNVKCTATTKNTTQKVLNTIYDLSTIINQQSPKYIMTGWAV